MRKVLVLDAGYHNSGKSRVIAKLLEGMKGCEVSMPCTATVKPYTGPDERIEAVVTDLQFVAVDRATAEAMGGDTFDMPSLDWITVGKVRLEDLVEPESLEAEPPVNWAVPGSYTMSVQATPEEREKWRLFIEAVRAAEVAECIRRMGKVIVVGAGRGTHLHSSVSFTRDRLEMMNAWDEKVVVKTRGKVHTTGRSRAARADRWR